MKKESVIQRSPLLRRILQAKRIPLLYSVTIIAGIFYHYAPKMTVVWIVVSLLVQAALFKLFDYVKKHNFLGGICYVTVGLLFLIAALWLMKAGEENPLFAPEDVSKRIDFFVWFMTPQSVLDVDFPGFTLCLFILFTFFIASVSYYFTFVRYRVLMSFMVLIFPFAIYAKENETMPVVSIIILMACYFAVMIYCRQAHAEDSDVVQRYQPDAAGKLVTPSKKSSYAGIKPEVLDGKFLNAAGIFIAAACILVLVIPKPEIEADRTFLETMLDMSALSDYLEKAISGFTDSSDGGSYGRTPFDRALYYGQADEPLNLRMKTFTNYSYEKNSWYASDFDKMPDQEDHRYVERDDLVNTFSQNQSPAELLELVQLTVKNRPDFAERWGIADIADETVDFQKYNKTLKLECTTRSNFVYPTPLHTTQLLESSIPNPNHKPLFYEAQNGVFFRYISKRSSQYFEDYTVAYTSESIVNEKAMQMLMRLESKDWRSFLYDLSLTNGSVEDPVVDSRITQSLRNYNTATEYMEDYVESETPQRIIDLANDITKDCETDYDKAMALRDYLKFGDFVYSQDFERRDEDNAETFLFDTKIGVCYEYATAMTELCRAVGLPARYVEGYSMIEPDNRLFGASEYDYKITTEHGHAFCDVYLTGYGWMMIDATSGNVIENTRSKANVLSTLQFSGLILLAVGIILILLIYQIIPRIREAAFRAGFRKHPDAKHVQAAFARMRRQWKADPAETARVLCAEQSKFLGVDLSGLLTGFEETLYADRCSEETAKRVYTVYCAAFDAYRKALRKQRKEQRQQKRKPAAETA